MTTRAALYLRVSSEMQRDNWSIPAQRRALETECERMHYEIARVYIENESAHGDAVADRPEFKALLDDVTAHKADVVLVHSRDRWARRLHVLIESLGVIGRAGASWASISEPSLDYRTPEGRVMLHVLGSFDEYFSDLLGQHVKKAKKERVEQGRHNNTPPFGYRRDGKEIVFDPDRIAAAREMWRLAAGGHTDNEIAAAMSRLGHDMSRDTVRYLLNNRFFLGEVCYGEEWYPGKQAPIIDAQTWQIVQAHRASHRRTRAGPQSWGATQRAAYAFGGLLTCARCGHHFQGNSLGRQYVCWGRRGYQCRQPMANAAALERQYGELLGRLTIPDDTLAGLVAHHNSERPDVNTDAVLRTMDRLRRQFLWGHIDEADYLREYSSCVALIKQAEAAIVVDDAAAALNRLRDIALLWQRATTEERHIIAGEMIADALVDEKRIVAVQPTVAWRDFLAVVLAPAERAGYLAV